VATLFALALLAAGAVACRQVPPRPTLAHALAGRGPARTRAGDFMRVAIEGGPAERRRAAFLWGLFACDAGAPASAVRGFSLAGPSTGAAQLAAVRLRSALEQNPPAAQVWEEAAAAAWLPGGERAGLLLRGAEVAAQAGDVATARLLLPSAREISGPQRSRWLAVQALLGGEGATLACHLLAVEDPATLATACPGTLAGQEERRFTSADWVRQAEAWLAQDEPREALRSARRAGNAGRLVAARATLALHRPSLALSLLARVPGSDAEAWLERSEAYRRMAWDAEGAHRRRLLPRMLSAADRALRANGPDGLTAARARLLMAEALTELGRFEQAVSLLADPSALDLPRWEWVRRRLLFLARDDPHVERAVATLPAGTLRGQRLAQFWAGSAAKARGDAAALRRLADGGFPDLPALWAAERLGREGVAVTLDDAAPRAPGPPAWAADLIDLGRVSDVVVGWRAELEQRSTPEREWLGLVHLASLPPLDAIPLLLRGEPRLLAGPWDGLSRPLLEEYLPLPWRDEVEAAARRAGVPPWVLAGLVRQESAWHPGARSEAGAVGLTQVLPATARELIRADALPSRWSRDLTDPTANLTLGAELLARWRQGFGGSWTVALACYNGGERRVRETWEEAGRRDGPEFVEALELPETWDYLYRVVLFAEGYRILYWPDGEAYPWTSSK
jgi:soluble lytic murein transglycosylase-like protein